MASVKIAPPPDTLPAAADVLIDMGPGGGPDGGRILARGTPAEVAADPHSVTGPYLASHLAPL
jgi:excinuclease ABC subunit A